MTRWQLGVAAGAFLAAAIGSPVVQAEGCLQRFSCQMYGECRLPCLDEMLGSAAPATPEALPSPAVAAAGTPSVARPGSVVPGAVARDTPPAKPKLARVARSAPSSRGHLVLIRMVAGREATSLAELAGKPVSFGPEGDPGQAVGRRIFATLGIKVQETPLDLDNALDGIATGDVAAVLVFRERDAAKLQAMGATTLHLVPAPAGASLPPGMTTAEIPPGREDALTHGHAVRTFAVETGLSSALIRQAALR